MTPSMIMRSFRFWYLCHSDRASPLQRRTVKERRDATVRCVLFLLLSIAALASLPLLARSQSLPDSPGASMVAATTAPAQVDLPYARPTQRTKVNNFVFDAFGPYPIAGAAVVAGINQASNAPPEWNQGVEGYSKRFGSDFAIAAVSTTTRYGLSEALKEDGLYYRCDCTGIFPATASRDDFDLDGEAGARWPPRLFIPCACCAVCRLDDRCLRLVPEPLWRQGRVSDRQL